MPGDNPNGLSATTALAIFLMALLVALAFVYVIDAARM
jgi:hypothetical protein